MTAILDPTAVVDDDPPLTVDELADLTDEDLATYVGENLDADDVWPALLDPAVIKRTKAALGVLRTLLDGQARHQSKTLRPAAYLDWWEAHGQPAARVVSRRRMQATKLLDGRHLAETEAQARHARCAVRELALAVQRHRLATVSSGLDPEPHDRDLWTALATLTLPYQGDQVALDELLGASVWEQP
jgi:hypothetical protein